MRIIGYMAKDPEHCLVVHPGSLNIVVSADASHADHPECKSHTGGCVGVRGAGDVQDSFFIFVSAKQGLVTKSFMESEIVAQNTMADWGLWSAGVRDERDWTMQRGMVSPCYTTDWKQVRDVM